VFRGGAAPRAERAGGAGAVAGADQQQSSWQDGSATRTATGEQHTSPASARRPSRTAIAAMTSAATGSAQAHPTRCWHQSDQQHGAQAAQISVCLLSATTLAEPSSRPVRRSNQDSPA
jgi:hypothetical protein